VYFCCAWKYSISFTFSKNTLPLLSAVLIQCNFLWPYWQNYFALFDGLIVWFNDCIYWSSPYFWHWLNLLNHLPCCEINNKELKSTPLSNKNNNTATSVLKISVINSGIKNFFCIDRWYAFIGHRLIFGIDLTYLIIYPALFFSGVAVLIAWLYLKTIILQLVY
jgi:hypothetical protein